jgi:MFS family permease
MFKRIYFFFIFYMGAVYFTGSLLVLWLSKNNFNFSDLIIYYLLTFFVALVGILYLPKNKISAKKAIFWGILLNLSYVLVLVKIFSPLQLYLSAILSGLNVVYFWVPYNIMYFKYSSENNRGLNSGIYFLITPIIGITLQPLSGIVAEKFGFYTMFFIGFLLYLIPLFWVRYLPDFTWNLDIKKEISTLKFNWSTFFQGIASRINWALIPIFSLFFLKTPKQFGLFFGYLGIVTALASVINGYISDKIKNRKVFFYLLSSLAVISFLPLAFVENVYYWGIFAGISSLCMSLANPFWLTFNLDYYKEIGVDKTMILREVFLNLGYVFNLLIVFLVFYFTSSAKTSLIVISLMCCLLPIVSYFQGVYRDKKS